MRKDQLLSIHLCCLDDNGGFGGKVTAIELQVWRDGWLQVIQFEHQFYPDVEQGAAMAFFASKEHQSDVSPWNQAARFCRIVDHWLPLRTIPASGGNIYWLTCCTDIEAGAELLLHLLRSKPAWEWSDASSALIDAFDTGTLDLPKLLELLASPDL